jgi:hypothetical protein
MPYSNCRAFLIKRIIMFYNFEIDGKQFLLQSNSVDLTELKEELALEDFGVITSDGLKLIGIDLLRSTIITVAPFPPNEESAP